MTDDAVSLIKQRLEIVDVIGGSVQLKRAGREYKGLCPFHSEKSPSFTVSPERQAWYCFGCSEGGDVFSFVQKIEHADFRQALELLAERAGVELEDHPRQGGGSGQKRKRLLEVHARAAQYFEHVLWETEAGRAGRELLVARGVDEARARAFGAGFAPGGGGGEDALSRYLMQKAGATLDELADGGLAHRSRSGGPRDRFRHRFVFPIRDDRGAVIAFGARAMGDAVPKYLNSPETPIYSKSLALYGLDMAREAIVAAKSAVIVEGYFDVIGSHAAGVTNVVASSGTALTREQVHTLARYCGRLVMCFDADDAGRAATSRAVDLAAAEGMESRIVVLPDDVKDPDELVRRDPAGFAAAVGGAAPEWQVLLDRALHGGEGGSLEERRRAAERGTALLVRIPEAATRDLYTQQAARRLDLSSSALSSDVARLRSAPAGVRPRLRVDVPAGGTAAATGEEERGPVIPMSKREEYIGAAVVQKPAVAAALVGAIGLNVSELQHPHVRRIVELALAAESGPTLPLHLLSADEQATAARLLLRAVPEVDLDDPAPLQSALSDCVLRMREAAKTKEMADISQRMRAAKEAGREDEVAALAAELLRTRRSAAVAAPHGGG